MLGVSLFPCRRSHPAGVVRRVSQCATAHAACTLPVAGSASGAAHLRGHLCVRLRYSLETRHHPVDGVVERLQAVGVPSPCSPSYRALAFPLVGFPPTEHASLRWTHNRTCVFPCIRLSIRKPFAGLLWIDGISDTAFRGLAYGVMSDLAYGAPGVDCYFLCAHISDI